MITVNGVKRTLEQPLSVTEYLEKNQYVPGQNRRETDSWRT